EKLGQMGDVVSVKPGYARNFLFPKKKALRASKGNLEHFESQRKELEAENLQRKSEAEDIGGRMDGLQVVIIRSAGEAGQLYGSVNARDISDAVSEEGFKISRNQVVIDRPIKMLGLFDIRIRLHPEVDSSVSVNVARSEDEAEQQRKLGRAIISQEEEERQAEEEARLAAAQAAEEMFDPEAQERAAAELSGDESEDSDASGDSDAGNSDVDAAAAPSDDAPDDADAGSEEQSEEQVTESESAEKTD
ncbi:MAG TPA: 50S ribosomal protein L9, partial [Rhodospirillaceae bacterium]|nr:50S ribosomal protein L9 [Rhodospirillaceae bacterium]